MSCVQQELPGRSARSAKYDNLKGLLIFLVVLGHAFKPYLAIDALSLFLYILIYSFHMPAFIFVLGKFAKPKWSRIRKFAILYLIFQPVLILFLNYVCRENVEFSLITPEWILWFLMASIVYSLFTFVLPANISNSGKKIIICCSFIVAILVGFIPFVGMKFSLSRILVFLPFFLLGKFGYFVKPCKWYFCALYLIGSIILVLVYILLSGGNNSALYMSASYTESNSTWYLRLMILAAAFGFIRFLISIMPDRTIPILTSIGKHTLFIFIAHGFVIKGLYPLYQPEIPALYALAFSVVTVIVLWGIAVLWSRFKSFILSKYR